MYCNLTFWRLDIPARKVAELWVAVSGEQVSIPNRELMAIMRGRAIIH